MSGIYLSETDFHQAISWFLDLSSKLHDGWQTESISSEYHAKGIYLKRRSVKSMQVSSSWKKKRIDLDFETDWINEDAEDRQVLNLKNCESDKLRENIFCQTEHHIVYSKSYSVPVMYFNIYLSDGELLTLDDVWNNCLYDVSYRQDNFWSFITQQEHPFLRRPFFQLHPCHTADLMRAAKGDGVTSLSPGMYLLSWLSCISPLVHLDVPLSYAKEMTRHDKLCSSSSTETLKV